MDLASQRSALKQHRLVANLHDFTIVVTGSLHDAVGPEGRDALPKDQDQGDQDDQAEGQHRPSGPAADFCPSVHGLALPPTAGESADNPRYHSPAPTPTGRGTAGSFWRFNTAPDVSNKGRPKSPLGPPFLPSAIGRICCARLLENWYPASAWSPR